VRNAGRNFGSGPDDKFFRPDAPTSVKRIPA